MTGYTTDTALYGERPADVTILNESEGYEHFTVRESVARFALLMNTKLDEKALKKGGRISWLMTAPVNLFQGMLAEVEELRAELIAHEKAVIGSVEQKEITRLAAREAADVANLGMMAIDAIGGLNP